MGGPDAFALQLSCAFLLQRSLIVSIDRIRGLVGNAISGSFDEGKEWLKINATREIEHMPVPSY